MIAVPEIDRLAGIECYCTSSPGVGGSIKQDRKGFRVTELVSDSMAGETAGHYDERHRYPLYLLEKEGVDSNHALIEIERKYHLRLRVMGIKDSRALTVQYAGSERSLNDPRPELNTEHCRLSLKGFTRKPLDKEFLAGNAFEITVHGASSNIDSFVPEIDRIGNFYGLQRFGSERLVTHLVGRELVRKNFKGAVEHLLSYTTNYDTPESREIREKCADPANYGRLAKNLPRGMDIERQVISALAAGKDSIGALRAIPITIRRLFVQAYQAHTFNRCLSAAISSGYDILRPDSGDLCFEMEGPLSFGRIIKLENAKKGISVVPAIRLAGSSFQSGRGRFERITNALLEDDGTSPKDFYIKEMQELSQTGGFRQAPLWCIGFNFKKSPALHVSFSLPKGSYATTLLRELMKPDDPIKAGF